MARDRSLLARAVPAIAENPFRTLGLTPAATLRDVEREGGRILAMIAAGLDDPGVEGPLAPPKDRTAEHVRWAMSELRDPVRRTVHEFFWLSAEPLPVDPTRVEELLSAIPLDLPEHQRVEDLVQKLAGELVPALPPWKAPLEARRVLDAAMAVDLCAPPICVDALDLADVLALPERSRTP